MLENDLSLLPFLPGSDEAYTNGARIDYGGRELGARRASSPRTFPFKADGSCFREGIALGLLMYTPRNLETPDLQQGDRSYAAFLYAARHVTRYKIIDSDVKQADTFELDLGILGPGAGGRWFQDTAHKLNRIESAIGQKYKRPLGWHHQLRNEIGIAARLLRQRRVAGAPATKADRRGDVLAHVGGAAGNIFTWALGGATVRYGKNVPNDLGPQQKQPSMFTSASSSRQIRAKPRSGWAAYVFAGGEGRLVLRNAFLDGNLFAANRPDMSVVQKQPFVIDGDVGFAVTVPWHLRFTYHYVMRSPEFKTPLGSPPGRVNNPWHRYGTMALMYGRGL